MDHASGTVASRDGAEGLVADDFPLSSAGQAAEQRFQAFLQTSSDAFFDVDLGAERIWWSRGVTLLLGHDPARVGDRLHRWRELVHPEDRAAVEEGARRVLPSIGETWSDELRLARADGTYAPVRVRAVAIRGEGGRPERVIGAVTDVSDVRERDRELESMSRDLADSLARERMEQARAEALFAAARMDVLTEWDLATGALRLSPSAETILGYAASEIADLGTALRYADPDAAPGMLADLQRAIDAGAPSWSDRVRFERRDGVEIVLDATAYVIRNTEGRPTKVVGSLTPAVTNGATGTSPASGRAPALTARQSRVLELLRAGRTNKEIAGELGISEQAAKAQVRKLMRKFSVPNRAALAAVSRL